VTETHNLSDDDLKEIFDLAAKCYRTAGFRYAEPNELKKQFDGIIRVLDDTGSLRLFLAFRNSVFGIKYSLIGHSGTKLDVIALSELLLTLMGEDGLYMEVSGAMDDNLFKHGNPRVVPPESARYILDVNGKLPTSQLRPSDLRNNIVKKRAYAYYSSEFETPNGTEIHRKIMIGRPFCNS
jgi:hypothetical protein